MLKRILQISIMMIALLGVPSIVGAQGGPGAGSPSNNGGRNGGSGMSGATGATVDTRSSTSVNPSFEAPTYEMPTFTAPTFEAPTFDAPDVSAPTFDAPTFDAPDVSAPTFDAPERDAPTFDAPERDAPSGGGIGNRGNGNATGNAPDVSAPDVNAPDFSGGERPTFTPPTLDLSTININEFSFSSGALFSGFSFTSERDSEQLWSDFGGFGSTSNNPNMPTSESLTLDPSTWAPPEDAAFSELPTAPAAYEDLTGVVEAATATATIGQNVDGESPDDITAPTVVPPDGENLAQAQENAANVYNQFWADYYAAVEVTAQAYYDTVAASVDYAYEAYIAAVNYTAATVDYYLAYYDSYYTYCYYYPWDCYMYAYDATADVYVDVSATSDAPVATTTINVENVTIVWPETTYEVPASSAEAYEAIVVFANDQLGAVVQPLYAGELTDEIAAVMVYLPEEVQAYALALLQADGVYWGIYEGGVAAIGSFDCTGVCGSDSAALSNGTGGVYTMAVDTPMPTDDVAALDLLTTVYPATNGLAFAKVENSSGAYVYSATTTTLATDENGNGIVVSKLVYVGVVEIDGRTVTFAVVAVGDVAVEAMIDIIA